MFEDLEACLVKEKLQVIDGSAIPIKKAAEKLLKRCKVNLVNDAFA